MTITRDFGKAEPLLSYNFDMPQMIYVLIKDQQNPCKVEAEKMEERGMQNSTDGRLVLKDGKDQVVAEFRSASILGWWKQSER